MREAELDWTQGAPVDRRSGDIYFNPENPLGESQHVFVQGLGGASLWQDKPVCLIAETGFGTGLNFLSFWQAWRDHPGKCQRLVYLSCEATPLTRAQMQQAHARFAPLSGLAERLRAALPPRIPGPHRRLFHEPDGRLLDLWLLYGEASVQLVTQNFRADGWALDGFAPAKNPELWNEEVLDQVKRLSAPDARLATFTAAGQVRRDLAARGWQVEKAPGFGRKRERLLGRLPGEALSRGLPKLGSISVVGAGIAGLNLARALKARGHGAVLVDKAGQALGAASGNPLALVNIRPGAVKDAGGAMLQAAFSQAQTAYETAWALRGTLKRARSAEEAERMQAQLAAMGWGAEELSWFSVSEAEAVGGLAAPYGGLWVPQAGALRPTDVLQRGMEQVDAQEAADLRVLTPGASLGELAPSLAPALRLNWGRVAWAKLEGKRPRVALTSGSYMAPLGEAGVLLGSTYEHEAPLAEAESFALLKAKLMQDFGLHVGAFAGSRLGMRLSTKDRLPLVGQVTPGIWVLGALASRGYVLSPLLAELLIDAMEGVPGLPTWPFASALVPGRFD